MIKSGTVADLIMQTLLHDFRDHTKKKIEEISKISINEKFVLNDIFEYDPTMYQLTDSIASMSKYHTSILVDSLVKWRKSLISEIYLYIARYAMDGTTKNTTSKEYTTIEERLTLSIEYIFCKILFQMFDSNGLKLNLSENVCSEIEEIAFAHFVPPKKSEPDSEDNHIEENRQKIPYLYAKVIGILSEKRVKYIIPRFLKEVTNYPVRSKKSVNIILGIRFLKLQLSNPDGVQFSVNFLNKLLDLFKLSQRVEVKQALSDVILGLLKGCALQPLEDNSVDLTSWYQTLLSLFQSMSFQQKKFKSKDAPVVIPVVTALLCAMKKSDFKEHYWDWTKSLLTFGMREVKIRNLILESILLLLQTFLSKCGESSMNVPHLEEVSNVVFQNISYKKVSSKSDPLDVFVHIAYTMALLKLSFTIEYVLFKLLSFNPNQPNTFQPERVIVAIRTIRYLKEGIPIRSLYHLPKEICQKSTALSSYWEPITKYWAQIFIHLDHTLGNLLYSTQVKTLYDLVKSDKDTVSLDLFQGILSILPTVIPKIEPSKLVMILSKCILHLDKGISEMAEGALSRLMSISEFRPHIVTYIAEHTMTLAHNRYDLIFTMLYKLSQLLKKWVDILKPMDGSTRNSKNEQEAFNPIRIECVAFLYLCCPKSKTRLLGLEILKNVRMVEELLIKSSMPDALNTGIDYPDIPTRVMDIIEEAGPDIIKGLQKETSFLNPQPLKVKTLEKLASKEIREDQHLWSLALGDLSDYLYLIQPTLSNQLYSLVLTRSRELKIDEKETITNPDQEDTLYWWRNYLIILCSIMPQFSTTTPASKEIIAMILPYLKSSQDLIREASAIALQNTNHVCLPILFEMLRPYEKEFQMSNDRKKGNKRDRLRFVVTSIYSYISETARRTIFYDYPSLKQTFIHFIQDTYLFISNNKNLLDKLHVRYEFCILLRYILNALYFAQDIQCMDEGDLRKNIFYMLARWCSEDTQEEATKKEMNSLLSYVKELDKKKAYMNVLEDHVVALQVASFSAMAACLKGASFDNIQSNEPLLDQIDKLLMHPREKLQKHSLYILENFLCDNLNQPFLQTHTLSQCYNSNSRISSRYFECLVTHFPQYRFSFNHTTLFYLILFKFGDSDSNIRMIAHELLLMVKSLSQEEDQWENIPFVIESPVLAHYESAQLEMSTRLTLSHPDLAIQMTKECVLRLDQVEEAEKKQMLRFILPWITLLDFQSLSSSILNDTMESFFKITQMYGKQLPNAIGEVWSTLGTKEANVKIILNRLLELGVTKQDAQYIDLMKFICVYVARGYSKYVVDAIVQEISDSNLHSFATYKDSKNLSRVHFTLIILSQLTYEISEQFLEHLPIIFQLAVLGLDTPKVLVYEHCRIILLNIIHALIVIPLESLDHKTLTQLERYEEALELEDHLKANAGHPLWSNEDITLKKTEIKSTVLLTSFIQSIVHIFTESGTKVDLAETWATQSLNWAIHGQSWHVKGRSFQIYRALKPTLTRDSQNILLECLLRSVHQKTRQSKESLAMTVEVLLTLQTIVQVQSAEKLILYPKLFWASVAMLQVDYEHHYLQAIKVFIELISRFNFGDKYVQNVFSASIPKGWDPPFNGLLPFVVRGLYSSVCESKSIEALTSLIDIPFGDILLQDGDPVIYLIFALLPFISTNFKLLKRQCSEIAEKFVLQCAAQGYHDLQNIFLKLSKFEYESNDDVVQDLKFAFPQHLVGKNTEMILSLLFSFLESGPTSWRRSVLLYIFTVLRIQFQTHGSEQTTEIEFVRPQWLAILLKQMSTSSWQLALQIIDLILQHSQLTLQDTETSSLKTVKAKSSKHFVNKMDQGCVRVPLALEAILSTESGKPSMVLDKSFFSLFDEGHDVDEEDILESSEVSEDVLIHHEGYDKTFEGGDTLDVAPSISAASMGRFPTFRGFEELLSKLESMPMED